MEALGLRQEQFHRDMETIKQSHRELMALVTNVAESQQRTTQIVTVLAEKHVELARKQAQTDERLNSLISVLEKHISNHGQAQ
jgi:hypothetical protein